MRLAQARDLAHVDVPGNWLVLYVNLLQSYLDLPVLSFFFLLEISPSKILLKNHFHEIYG